MGKEGMNETQLGYKLDTDLNQTGLQARGRGRPSAHGQLGLPGCAEGARGHRCPPPFPDKRLWTWAAQTKEDNGQNGNVRSQVPMQRAGWLICRQESEDFIAEGAFRLSLKMIQNLPGGERRKKKGIPGKRCSLTRVLIYMELWVTQAIPIVLKKTLKSWFPVSLPLIRAQGAANLHMTFRDFIRTNQ